MRSERRRQDRPRLRRRRSSSSANGDVPSSRLSCIEPTLSVTVTVRPPPVSSFSPRPPPGHTPTDRFLRGCRVSVGLHTVLTGGTHRLPAWLTSQNRSQVRE